MCCALLAALGMPFSPALGAGVIDPCPPTAYGGGWCGDGGPATAALLGGPSGVAGLGDGGFLIADTMNNVVRRVWPTGVITRFAGIGAPGYSGDGGPATSARIGAPSCVRVLTDGSVVIGSGEWNRRVVRGVISTVSGPDPCAPALYADGTTRLVVGNNEILRVYASGSQVRVAGTGDCGNLGDGGFATQAGLANPRGVSLMADGGFVIADSDNDAIRRVWPNGAITTVAGRFRPHEGGIQCGAGGEYAQPVYLQLRLPLRGKANRPVTIQYETTYSVSVVITIRRGPSRVAQFRANATAGPVKFVLPVKLRAAQYSLELKGSGTAVGAGEQAVPFTKRDTQTLLITK